MKYGKELEQNCIEIFRHLYLEYNDLKKEIKKAEARKKKAMKVSNLTTAAATTETVSVPDLLKVPYHAIRSDSVKVTAEETLPFPDDEFSDAFEQELDKVDGFYRTKCLELDTRLNGVYARVLQTLESLKRKKLKDLNQNEFLHRIQEATKVHQVEKTEADTTSCLVIDVATYARQNATGFKKIAKKYNRRVASGSLQWLNRMMEKKSFYNSQMDVLLLGISDVYRLLLLLEQRLKELPQKEEPESSSGAWIPPAEFRRRTEKYWVHPDAILAVKVILAQHIPILIFGTDYKKEDEKRIKKFSARNRRVYPNMFQNLGEEETKVSALISSVYFDNLNHDCYAERLHKAEGAILVRARWYAKQEPTKKIFLERKVHHEKESGESSVKERFEIPLQSLYDYMQGDWKMEERRSNLLKKNSAEQTQQIIKLANAVQSDIISKSLVPILRTSYIRTSFQGQESNDFRATFDTHLCLTREDAWKTDPRKLFRAFVENMNSGDVFLFPKAILELKFATGPNGEELEAPEWVNSLLQLPGVTKANKFSKFIHASASLYPELLEKDPPSWFQEVKTQTESTDVVASSIVDNPGASEENRLNILTTSNMMRRYGWLKSNAQTPARSVPQTPTRNSIPHTPTSFDTKALSSAFSEKKKKKKKKKQNNEQYEQLEEEEPIAKVSDSATSKNLSLQVLEEDTELSKKQKKDMLQHIKTSMANERTLLNWMSPVILLLSVSIGLFGLGGDSSKVFAFIIGAVSVIFSIYALTMFHLRRRALLLKKMSTKLYDDPYGPSLLVILLLGALVASASISIYNGATAKV